VVQAIAACLLRWGVCLLPCLLSYFPVALLEYVCAGLGESSPKLLCDRRVRGRNLPARGCVSVVTMTKRLLFAGAILLAAGLAATAADSITGKWVYEMQMGRGGGGGGGAATPRQITLDLKVDGAVLTGTILQPAFGRGRGGGGADAAPAPAAPVPVEIKNGKVNGDSISFEVTRAGRNGDTTTKYEGTVSGGELKLKITAPGRGGGEPVTTDVTAKRPTT